ncbi:MAG: DUF7388 family protein [Candidatus Hodarchaeales archaeon]
MTADKHHSFVFLDYEGKDNLLTLKEIKDLLHQFNHTLVLTVAVRALEFQNGDGLWRSYLDILADNSNVSVNLVAGHSAYNIDRNVSAKIALRKYIAHTRERTDRPIFLGVDNLSSTFVKSICQSYSGVIPFALNGDFRLMNGFSNSKKCPLAIYTPLTIKARQDEETYNDVFPYLMRRKTIQQRLKAANILEEELKISSWSNLSQKAQTIIKDSLNELIITDANLNEKVKHFRSCNVRILVGYPAISSIKNQQIEGFKIGSAMIEKGVKRGLN